MKFTRLHLSSTKRNLIAVLLRNLVMVAMLSGPSTWVTAQTLYWDANATVTGNDPNGTQLGGSGTWNTSALNWWDAVSSSMVAWPNTTADNALFGYAFPTAPYAIPTPFTVTVDIGGVTANRLSFFRSGYTLMGDSITLAGTGAGLHVNLGESIIIDSIVAGTDGLILTGGGSVRLTGANTYTGTTTIANGSLIISNPAALGGTGAVNIVTTNNAPLNTSLIGFGGGSLVLDGTLAGFTFTRDVDFEGRGPIGDRGSAILSLGNNTLSGTLISAVSPLPLSPTATIRNSRINSVNGTLTLSGTLSVGGTAGTTVTNLGGANAGGVGNFSLTGVLAGTGSLEKSGAGTLFLNASDTAGFSGRLRISSSATGQQSTVRVSSLNDGLNTTSIFGSANSGTTSAPIDMNGGVLEIRSDSSLNFGKNIYQRASSTIFVGPAAGGSALNGTTTFGTMSFEDNITNTFSSRNGYGVSFTTAPVVGTTAGDNNSTITNNLGGTLSFTGNFWSNSNNTGGRTMTIGGNGNMVINGNVIASAAAFDHILTKTGTGSLTITGTGSTLDGAVNVQGSLAITDFRSISNNTSNITLSNATTTVGNLIIGTAVTPTAGGLTTSRPIVLNGTTVSPSIYANQTGGNPVILNGSITRPAATTGGLILGGTNTADNTVNVGIPNAGTGGLLKTGPGTWVLAGTNAYTGATNIVNGTLKIKADAPASTIFAATHDITFGNSNVFAGGTLEFVGQDGVNNVQTLDVLTTSSGASTIRLTPGAGGTASLTFASQATGAAGTVNFVGADFVNNKITITGGNGLISRTNYWEGADFAYRESNVLRAPVYGTDSGFVTSASALTAAANMEITGSFAANTVSISTLKIAGSHTLTLNAAQTVTLSNGGVLVTGGDAIITGGTALALGTQALVVRTNLDTDSLDIQSVVTGSGGLTKSGAGTLILSGVNTQTGTVTINEGTVQLSGSGRLGAAAALTMRQGTVLDLNGVTPSTNTNAFNNNGSVTSASPASFTVGGANGTGTSFGTVNGAISLTKIGTGGQSWLGNSTYTGVTTIGSTGLVTVDTLADGGTPSGIGASTNAASNLVFNGSTGGLVYAGNIRNGELILGSRSASTDRLFTLAGTGARLSSTASNNNAIVWSNTGAIVHGIVGPQLLTFEGTSTGDNTFNPQLTDSGVGANITSVTKTGTGQWNLGNSNNTYTGTTTVANGVLALNHTGALPANSPLVLGSTTTSGILQTSGTFTRNLATTPTAGTGTGTITWGGTTGGGGFAAHATPLTVTLNGGAGLTWGSGGFVGTGETQALIFGSATAATATGLSDVTFTNAIDLGAVSRTITVNDNINTGADYATVSGVLSGAGGGVTKTGNGILRLGNANTYTGTTEVQAGTLVIQSLGSSSGGGSSSVGAGGVTMDNSNAVVLGNVTTTGGILQYVGPGETSDRKIRLRGTTAGSQIHADGAGALILTNVAHDTTETGNKTLSLRGTNTAGNMITSALTDNGAGVLSVTVDGGATWILTGTNTFTGNLTAGAGALGIGNAAAVGAGTLFNSNGNIFAYGADRTITNALTLGNNTTNGWLGDYSLTFTGANNLAVSANSITTNNSIVAGKTLTFQGLTANALTAARAWTIDGPGETVINGDFTTSTAFGVNITKNGNGTLTLGTNGATSNWNQAGSALDVDRGTLKFTANNAIPTASAANTGLTISPEVATGDTATVDLNGTTQTVNALTATTNGTLSLNNTSASAATFRFGANNTDVNFGGTSLGTVAGTGSYTITDTGTGALSIVKLGNTSTTFGSHVVLTHQGTTAAEGGTFTINANLAGSTGLSASGGSTMVLNGDWTTSSGSLSLGATGASTLSLLGAISSPNLVTSVEVGGGSTLSLLDGAGSQFSNLTTLNLGNTGTGTVTLNLNIGDLSTPGDNVNTDLLNLLTGGTLTLGNTITFNLTDAGLNPLQTYTLLNVVDGGLTGFGLGNFIQGSTPGGFSGFTWNVTDNLVQITTGTLITGDLFWRGVDGGGTDNTWNAGIANWSQDKANTIAATTIPGQGTDVIFAIDGGAGAYSTTLEQNFKINSLTFEAGTSTPTSVTIAPGAVPTNRLEIAPQVATDGIAITAGGPASVTISSPFRLGADQTWTVADSGSTLTLSGGLQGERDVTKAGVGKVVLSAAADPTFNGGQTADFTVTAGTLEITNSGALGTTANSNAANVVVNSGGAFYYNGVTGTVNNHFTLGGGTLSAGTANQTYSGTVNVASASTINMADSNTAPSGTARNITLSGVVSGSGSLTIDSNNTPSNGNQINGTLTISNAASTWNGDLLINRGTVTIATAASPTVTPANITFNSFGKVGINGIDGQTINLPGLLTLAAGAVGEFNLDNTTGTPATDYVVNQNGVVTLGSGGTGGTLRVFLADTQAKLNLLGGVTLGGNSSISVANNAARLLTIDSVISDGGSGYSLAINDDAGAWGQTNGTALLTALNTFSGNFALGEGIAEFNTVTNAGGAASSLGQGNAISLGGGNLRFVGFTNQSTNRPIATTASSTLSAHGTGGASITYTGPITQTLNNTLTLSGTDNTTTGFITGGITQTGTAADVSVTSGNWTISGAPSVLADDIIATNANAVLNLNGASLISFTTGTSNGLYARTGATINLLSNDIFGPANSGSLDFILLGDNSTGGGTLNTNTFTIETPRLDLGQRTTGYEGQIDGTGTVLVTGGAIDLFRGTVNANLSSTGTTAFEKISTGTVTLKGDNSGLTSTGSSIVYEGTLVLDYSANTATKFRTASALDMRGGNLVLNGNASSAVAQSVGSFTLGSGGNSIITLNPAGSQDLVLNLGAITRAVNAQDGTLRINLPSGTQSATYGVTTTTGLTNGLVGTAGYVTVEDSTGTWFATKTGNNIIALASSAKNDVATWAAGDHITDETTGFTGTYANVSINSLRFDAAAGSSVNLGTSGVLGIATGGILFTDNVGGTPSLMNGTIFSGAQASNVPELIITQDSASTFELGADLRTNSAFTKSGPGTVLLSGNNVYTGVTEIQNGILQLSGGNAIGDTSLVTLATYRNSTLQLMADETIGRLQGGQRQADSDNGMVNMGTHTLTINQSATTTYSGRFNGSGVIVLNAGSTGNLNYAGQTSTGLFTGSVIVNGGLFQLSGDTARLGSATSFTINGSGNFLLDNNATANTTDRISDSATFTLNSAAGAFSSETRPRGLANRNDDNDDAAETIGLTTFNSGASYLSLEASGGSSSQARIVSTGWARNNAATVNVRGRNLGATSDATGRTQFKVQDANDAAMLAANIGGGGTIGGTAKNVSIIPWAIGESLTAALADGNMGNTFVSYVDNRGFVPLNLTNEFSTFAAATPADNVRESLGADLLLASGPATTINALILNNTAFVGLDVTGAGVGESLAITSGALMFTVTSGAASTAYDTTLGGFDSGITVGGTNEYVIHVVNPSSATTTSSLTATIASPLTSSADITKSGRGTLILSGTNIAGGGARKTTLNEGFLQISDLDNIGGNSGALVFAGGGLRFGAGLADDISLRTISILQGGATLDTNGVDLALANSVGSGVGGLTKTGAGSLTLNGSATYTGNSVLSLGTITVGAANALGLGGNLTLAGGTTLALGTSSLTHGLVTTSGASPGITGTGTINASTGFFLNHTGDTAIEAILAGTGGLLKTQTNVVTLSGANTYIGTTEVQNGTLSINSIANVGGGASALGAPTTAENGIIRMGLTTAATTLTYTGSGHTSDRLIGMQGTTGGVTLNGNGTGAVGYGGARFENAGNKTLTLGGTSASGVNNSLGGLQGIGGVLALTKSGANTWVLTGPSDYTGSTTVQDGILRFTADKTTTTGTLTLGTASTAGSLELSTGSAAFTTMSVVTNSSSLTNNLVVDAGETLTLSGNVTIGANAAASTTLFNATGGGSFVNTNSGGTFQVGGGTGTTNVNAATADFSGLAHFTVDLGFTGTFRVGDNNTNSAGTPVANSTLILASTANTITAGTLQIGQGAGQGASVQTLTLGAGTNVINADTINIGGNTTRSGGAINFAGATGSVTVRAADGTSRAVVNMTNGGISTGFNQINDFLLAGHTADVLVSTLTMASRSASTGFASATLSFDQGTLDVTSLTMASRTLTGTGNATATVNLGDSAAPGTPTVIIGAINMAVNTSAGGTVTASLNVTGGNVTIGTGSGTAINMANAGTGRTVTSNINLTGGTVDVTGNIVRTGGLGTEIATVTLNGGALDMNGNSMGSSASPIVLAAQSGTLENLAELNGGGVLTKTTAGSLSLGNGNTYTGGTLVNAGTLLVNNTLGSGTGSGNVTVDAGGTLAGSGTIASTQANAAVAIQGLLNIGNVGDTAGSDFAINLSDGTSTFTLGGIVQLDLWSGLGAGGGTGLAFSDLLAVNANTIDLTGSTLRLNNSSGLNNNVFAVGDTWKLFDWTSVAFAGSFSNITSGLGNFADLPDLNPYGLAWDTSALYTTGHIAVGVPEPSRALLLLMGLLTLSLRRRRSQCRA